jgi:post-segregation antitoxin (ccd killing protein)
MRIMARVNVHVPDELMEAARRAGLNVSALTQEAIRSEVAAGSTDAWLASLAPALSPSTRHESVLAALDAGRAEAPTRHG